MSDKPSGSQSQALEANKNSNASVDLSNVSADNSIKVGISDEAFTQSLFGVASLVGGITDSTQKTLQQISSNASSSNASIASQVGNIVAGNSFGAFLQRNYLYIGGAVVLYFIAKKKGWI